MPVKFPLGKDSFPKLREEGCYYVDKTEMIEKLLDESFDVQLITRPRRFGKTLIMSMLEDFFDISRESTADFADLQITENKKLCQIWMNQWPVVFITLKTVEGNSFESAFGMLKVLISDICKKYGFLGESDKVDESDRTLFNELRAQKANLENLKNFLKLLTRMMYYHYGKQVIVLIDEYDVPLAKASEEGYYKEMTEVIRAVFSALKTNDYLKFAVVTGCLKIAKESIFTGTNNFVTDTIMGDRFDEYIGFTEMEVQKLLADTGFSDHEEEIRRWYDGYHFGCANVYCPWDVLNHVAALQINPYKLPQNYWGATSHNGVIYRFISREDLDVNHKFELLMADQALIEPITEDLTYDTLKSSETNLWSLLFMTGYLTKVELPDNAPELLPGEVMLRIPNEEVKAIFKASIVDWFQESIKTIDRRELFEAMWNDDAKKASEEISDLLFSSISYHDYQESYYHAFIAGLFAGAGYIVESNYERGNGRPDIVIKDRRKRRALLIEIKHTKDEKKLKEKCKEALAQIAKKRYSFGLEKGYRSVICYGAAFCEKECLIESIGE